MHILLKSELELSFVYEIIISASVDIWRIKVFEWWYTYTYVSISIGRRRIHELSCRIGTVLHVRLQRVESAYTATANSQLYHMEPEGTKWVKSMAINTQGTGHHIMQPQHTPLGTKVHSQWTETNWRSVETKNWGSFDQESHEYISGSNIQVPVASTDRDYKANC